MFPCLHSAKGFRVDPLLRRCERRSLKLILRLKKSHREILRQFLKTELMFKTWCRRPAAGHSPGLEGRRDGSENINILVFPPWRRLGVKRYSPLQEGTFKTTGHLQSVLPPHVVHAGSCHVSFIGDFQFCT